jgi:hypothetical protein
MESPRKSIEIGLPELKKLGFRKMLTFADLRLHTGELYKQLGFTFEEKIQPNYYYTNGVDRKTKYAFRVKAGVNETLAAREKGWHRIYDVGKLRFSL